MSDPHSEKPDDIDPGAEQLTPERVRLAAAAAKDAADRAEKAADTAKATLENAQQFNAQELANSLAQTLKKSRLEKWAPIAGVILSLFTLCVLVWQNVQISDQYHQTEISIEKAAESIALAREQLDSSAARTRVDYISRLQDDKSVLEGIINDPDGFVETAESNFPDCEDHDDLRNMPEEIKYSLNLFSRQLLAYYARYYYISVQLNLPQDWHYICVDARRIKATYCHLGTRMDDLLKDSSTDFREAFSTCDLHPSASD